MAACFVREGDAVTEVRYPGCPACGHRCETGCCLREEDVAVLTVLERRRIKEWYPQHRLFYPDGAPFKEKQRYDSLDQLFTKRNLQAVAWLYEAIQAEKSPQIRKFLMGAFTSTVHLCTRMCPALARGEGNHQTAFSSTWTQHSYWSARRFLEQNVWLKYESAVTGHQGLLKAKAESDSVLPKARVTSDWREVLAGKEEITEERFRRIVIETCREGIAERAEPTPYTLLINYVDPKLARLGFFGTLDTGLDVKTALEQAIGSEFRLVSARIGGAEGKLWWFQDPVFVKRLNEVPLSERVEYNRRSSASTSRTRTGGCSISTPCGRPSCGSARRPTSNR